MAKNLAVVILAAGRGTRMKSDLPKALQPICGQTMLEHLLDKADALGSRRTVVVAGYGIERVRAVVGKRAEVVEQKKLLGSGHAVQQAEKALRGFRGSVMVLYCDTPHVSVQTLRQVLNDHRRDSTNCTLLSVELEDATGYGRIRRDGCGCVMGIVEETDASAEEKKIREINVGCYAFEKESLFAALARVERNPRKKEYYLTDAVGLLASTGRVGAVVTPDREEVLGVNTRQDLARLEDLMQKKTIETWIERGVRFRNPASTTIDAGVEIGHDTLLLPGTILEENTVVGKNCVIGPFARIRGASRIGDGCVIGNFVEIVRSKVGAGTQIKHLSYIGDAEIGRDVNVGAGTITANYDGKKKHKTVIKDGARIGSGTVLVAPVIVGRSAVTGAGAVLTKGKNVPDRAVVVGVPARKIK